MTGPALRPVAVADHAEVLALNEADVDLLAPMDEARLRALRGWADRFDVVDVDGRVAGFVVTIGPGTAYDSDNYRWFSERHGDRMAYLDRIVLAPAHRRGGLGSAVYDAVERDAARHGRLCLEVNVEPPNEPSLAFHDRRGFTEVGRRSEPGHVVAMLVKELPGPEAAR